MRWCAADTSAARRSRPPLIGAVRGTEFSKPWTRRAWAIQALDGWARVASKRWTNFAFVGPRIGRPFKARAQRAGWRR